MFKFREGISLLHRIFQLYLQSKLHSCTVTFCNFLYESLNTTEQPATKVNHLNPASGEPQHCIFRMSPYLADYYQQLITRGSKTCPVSEYISFHSIQYVK